MYPFCVENNCALYRGLFANDLTLEYSLGYMIPQSQSLAIYTGLPVVGKKRVPWMFVIHRFRVSTEQVSNRIPDPTKTHPKATHGH